jgi:Flp pilus assembly protein TadG
MIRPPRNLARNQRGTSVVELALIAPVMLTLLVGMVDAARAYSFKLGLEQAAQRSIEKVMQYRTTKSTYDTLYAEAADAAGVTAAQVDVKYWLECNGVSKYQSKPTMEADYSQNCTSGQIYARYINVTVRKNFTPMFGTRFFPGANADGTFTIRGVAGIRTQ